MKNKDNSIFRTLDSLCLMWIIGICIYTFISYANIPDVIPMHYNFMGEIDRYGDKSGIFVLLLIMILMHSVIGLLEGMPRVWNTGIRVTEANKEEVYMTIKSMLKTLKYLVSILMGYLIIVIIRTNGFSHIIYIMFIVLVVGNVAYWIYRLYKIAKKYS